MSVLDATVKAIREHLPDIEDASEKGLAQGLQRARDYVSTLDADPSLRGDMLEVLDRVEMSSGSMSHLVGHNLAAVLERVFYGVGAAPETRDEYFKTEIGFEELRQAMRNRTEAKLRRQLAKEESWDEFVEMLEEIGKLALRAVVPILLAAI